MDWRDRANCIGTDTDAFFPDPHATTTGLVKRICAACEVQAECLDWALRHEATGWWAGTNEKMRDDLRREMGIPYSAPEVSILGRAG